MKQSSIFRVSPCRIVLGCNKWPLCAPNSWRSEGCFSLWADRLRSLLKAKVGLWHARNESHRTKFSWFSTVYSHAAESTMLHNVYNGSDLYGINAYTRSTSSTRTDINSDFFSTTFYAWHRLPITHHLFILRLPHMTLELSDEPGTTTDTSTTNALANCSTFMTTRTRCQYQEGVSVA